MSAWVVFAPRPKPPVYVRNPRPYSNIAKHIRGRVFRIHGANGKRPGLWGYEVINTHTGKVLASDNCTIRQSIVDSCDETTAAARAAWFWDFKPKAVQP